MGIQLQTTESEFTLHEDGEFYTGTIVGYDDMPAEESAFGKSQFKWKIYLDDDPEGSEVWVFTGQKLSKDERNKLRSFLIACGFDPDSGEVIDTDDVVGRRIRVLLEHYTNKDGEVREKATKFKAAK